MDKYYYNSKCRKYTNYTIIINIYIIISYKIYEKKCCYVVR